MISFDFISHSFPSTFVILPPASVTNNTPLEISHKLRFFSQKASSLPAATYAKSNPAEPNLLIPAETFNISSISNK